MDTDFEQQLGRLNPEQRAAVEHVDGPLLVIAGPGTGKTQLLSLRAANILATRGVLPKNILCLTFGNAGAEAMRKRLVELIGRDAYGIEVSTFHGFASGLRSRHPECFERGAFASVVTELRKREIVNGLLNSLSPSSPLYSGQQNGINARLDDVLAFIGHFKRSGLLSDEFRSIMRQSLAFFDHIEANEAFMGVINSSMPRAAGKKEAFCTDFEVAFAEMSTSCPLSLRQSIISTPGIYVPYATWLGDLVSQTELMDENGGLTGFKELRDRLFAGTASEGKSLKDRMVCERALAVIDIYDAYEQALEDAALYDYDDMILEAIEAIQTHPDLASELHERYLYIQVDEFQDTNGSQMRILELLAGSDSKPNVMAVCDDDQAIMRFQGATIECIQQFQRRWNPTNIVLKTNYRSTPAIVELGKGVASQIALRLPSSATEKDISAFRPAGSQVGFVERVYASKDAQLYGLAEDIRVHLDDGFVDRCDDPDEAIAVIAPKHASLKALLPYLNEFDIPFSYRETSDVFRMESMQTLLACMRFAAYAALGRTERAEAQLPQIVAASEFGLVPEQCLSFAACVRRDHHGSWMSALKSLGEFGQEGGAQGSQASDAQLAQEDTSSKGGRLDWLHERLVRWSASASSAPVRELVFEMARPIMAFYKAKGGEDPWALAEFNAGVRALLSFVEGEIACRGGLDRAVRLTDVVERMAELERYGVSIDAAIALGREGAVRLVSAHGSKGLEFDRVYLLDADDDTWHRTASSSTFFANNMLIGNAKDDDDARRLLFVALTRAKSEMEMFRAGGRTLRELQGEIDTVEVIPTAQEAAEIIGTSWRSAYAVDTPAFASLLVPDLVPRALSASALNDFVEYREGAVNSQEFPANRMLRLPSEPSSIMEFGTCVHAFLQDYVDHVMHGTVDGDELAGHYRQKILWMDYRREEVESLARRFDRIVASFVPWLADNLSDRLVTEASVSTLTPDEVPLFGFCDLLVVDDVRKTVRVFDYKTGFNYPGKTPTTSYERQLKFYKLLIEGSQEYDGYSVIESVDLYVEPERGSADALHPPVVSLPSDADLDRLRSLISVVWRRINEGDFDTSAFETSDQKAVAMAANVTKDGSPRKNLDHRLFQRAYEDWLIEQG